jgi:hypothetical protein
MKPILLAVPISALLLSGCETTGDPQQGGLFGWSEGKARTRSDAIEQALYVEDDRTAAARDSRSSLERTRARNASSIRAERAKLGRLLVQLDQVEARGGRTAGLRQRINTTRADEGLEDAELRSRVQSLDREVRSMRAEYGLLQERR